jgi:hypothetical protein
MSPIFAGEIRKRAWKAGKICLALKVWIAITINGVVKFVLTLIKLCLPQKLLYQIKSKFLKPERNEEGITNDHP